MSTAIASPPGFQSACTMLRLGVRPSVVEAQLQVVLGFEDVHDIVELALIQVREEKNV